MPSLLITTWSWGTKYGPEYVERLRAAVVWSDFSLEAAAKVPHAEFPDDQAWFEAKMPDAGALGAEEGVFAFQKRNWPRGDALPKGARIVAFPGWRDPSKFTQLEWVKEHWASGAIGRDELARGQA
jgi:hypothetical protein